MKLVDLRGVTPTFRWTTDAQLSGMSTSWTDAVDVLKGAAAKGQTTVVAAGVGLKEAPASGDRKAIETAAGRFAAAGVRGWQAR